MVVNKLGHCCCSGNLPQRYVRHCGAFSAVFGFLSTFESWRAVPWRNVFSGRNVFIISCDLRFKFCVSYALFLYAVPLDRNLASQIMKRYLSWHGFWPRAVKVPRFTWQCQITFALGAWLTNEFFNGQPVGELVLCLSVASNTSPSLYCPPSPPAPSFTLGPSGRDLTWAPGPLRPSDRPNDRPSNRPTERLTE